MKWYSATEVAKILNVVPATVGGLIDDGSLGAINIARRGSVRKRHRISEKHLAEFEAARENPKPADDPKCKASRRTIAKPVRDYFAKTGGGK